MKCGPATCLSVPLAHACICCCTTPRQPSRSAPRAGGLGETEDDDARGGCRAVAAFARTATGHGCAAGRAFFTRSGLRRGETAAPPRSSIGRLRAGAAPPRSARGWDPQARRVRRAETSRGARLGAHCPAVFSVIRSRRPTAVVYENGVLRANSTLPR